MRHASPRCSTRLIAGFIALWLIAGQTLAPDAQARPKYKSVFQKLYPKFTKVSCAGCHPEKSKKVRNHYANALGKEISKNEKNEKKIEDALRAIEGKKCPGETKTWGSKLEKGIAPCKHGGSKRPHRFVPSYIERLLAAPEDG